MANLPETPDYPAGVYQIETSDPVLGGPGGIANRQAEQLGNRTAWLKAKVDAFIDGTVAVLKATKLATARTLSISGAGNGNASFDGSANANIVLTLADSGAMAGTYPKVTINTKGLVTAGSAMVAADIPSLDWSKITTGKPTTLGGYGITDAAPRGAITSLSASANITAAQLGVLLLDAGGGARTFTLPAADAALGVIECVLRRVDATANALTIAASGTDKLMLDTTADAAGVATTELLFSGDFMRLRSDGAGKWWCVGQAQLPGSIASGLVVYSAAGSNTFTVPPVLRSGRRRAKVKVLGGGGGGGANTSAGSGGSGGGEAIKLVNLTGVTSVSVTVGAPGIGAPAGSNGNGTGGGTSSFGAFCSATGGTSTTASGASRGTPGTGTGGDINNAGGYGGQRCDTGTGTQMSGFGGYPNGGGLTEGGTGVSGFGAIGPGGGGGGGGNAQGKGGDGAAGSVTIEW